MKLACVAPDADWGTGEDEGFFVNLLKDAGLPVERMTFGQEIPGDADFVILCGRAAIRPFVDVDPGLMLARPFVIRERPRVTEPGDEQQIGFPMLHWSSYRRNPNFRQHVPPVVQFLKTVAASYKRGEFWFEHAPISCAFCDQIDDGILVSTHWIPVCPGHADRLE